MLYIQFGRQLLEEGALRTGSTPESFAEIRVYTQDKASGFKHSYQFLPNNIFSISLKKIMELEILYWEKLIFDNNEKKYHFENKNINASDLVTCHLPKTLGLLSKENIVLDLNRIHKCSSILDDHSTKSSIPKTLFQTSLLTRYEGDFFSSFGYKTLGPIFCSYGLWVLAQELQTPCYGIMREGDFLSKVIATLGGNIGGQLYLSRLSSLKAVLADPDEEEAMINFLLRSRTGKISLLKAITSLEITDKKDLPFDPATLISHDNLPKVMSWLNKNNIKEQWLSSARTCQINLIRHLEQIIESHRSELILLDMGYAGNILANLMKIFRYRNIDLKCRGRFFLSSVGALWAQRNGCEIRGFLSQNGAPHKFSSLYFRTPELLELCCAIREGTTTGYTNLGQPNQENAPLPKWQYLEIEKVQKGVLKFICEWQNLNYMGQESMKDPKVIAGMEYEARKQLTRLLSKPTREEAERLGRWLYDANLGTEKLHSLAELRACDEREIWKYSREDVYWPGAYSVLSHDA